MRQGLQEDTLGKSLKLLLTQFLYLQHVCNMGLILVGTSQGYCKDDMNSSALDLVSTQQMLAVIINSLKLQGGVLGIPESAPF